MPNGHSHLGQELEMVTLYDPYWSEIALSTTEAEYIALSQAMQEVLPFMNLLKELAVIFDIYLMEPKVHCKVYKDNNGCIAVAQSPDFNPRTKRIALKYHHFRSFATGPANRYTRTDG
eukprot:scaffold238285_cov31-Attheya_sp.AAC.1